MKTNQKKKMIDNNMNNQRQQRQSLNQKFLTWKFQKKVAGLNKFASAQVSSLLEDLQYSC